MKFKKIFGNLMSSRDPVGAVSQSHRALLGNYRIKKLIFIKAPKRWSQTLNEPTDWL